MLKLANVLALLGFLFGTPLNAQVEIGRVASDDEISAWNIDVRPDGQGLPLGSGNVLTGEEIFSQKCSACHGDFGEGLGLYPALAGGEDTLVGGRPVKSIGSFVPYLSTIFDFINRAKPFGDAQSLTDDQTYALVAYLLYLNDLVDEDFILSDENFTDIRLPNEGNFFPDDRDVSEIPIFSAIPCMSGCKDSVEITARGLVDVTPTVSAVKVTEYYDREPSVASGEKLFKKCKACHQIGAGAKNRVGPVLTGVVGRVAGEFEGFGFSKPMVDAGQGGLIWDDAALVAFLANPRKFIKGTKMSFAGIKNEGDLFSIVKYLASVSE